MKFTSLMVAAFILSAVAQAQSSTFVLNNATASSANGDCATLQQLKVSFPVPANVSTYDCYFINLNLSSLDVPAFIFFDKDDIRTKLTGKKEYKAAIVQTDGNSEFTFDDTSLSMRDLCFVPRMWGMSDLTLEVVGIGHKIVGYHWEDVWDEQQQKWISSKVADWDKGVTYGSGRFTIKQRPVTDGMDDATGFIKVKPAGSSRVGFGEPIVADAITTLSLNDTSLGIPVQFVWCVYDAADYSKEKIKEELGLAFHGREKETNEGTMIERSSLFGGYMDEFQYFRSLSFSDAIPVKGKLSEAFTTVTMGSKTYDHMAFREKYHFTNDTYSHKLVAGKYINSYVATIGDKTVAIIVTATDLIAENYESVNFDMSSISDTPEPEWFDTQITDNQLSSIDALIDKTISATSYNQ